MRLLRAIVGGFRFRRTPWALLAAGLLLGLVGVVFITSAESWALGRRHLQFLALGVVAFLITAVFDYRHLASISIVLYAGGLAALGLLPFLGETRNFATRWYDV
ncbi:MAG: FtsW/RodA/SpoVE family cell cycle protein, partial [Candidatus Brocadiia bacterium]|nr:FtsW/RodA/SpoVE family cell cycle protein [Candidatus Brocadiia bacterium]